LVGLRNFGGWEVEPPKTPLDTPLHVSSCPCFLFPLWTVSVN